MSCTGRIAVLGTALVLWHGLGCAEHVESSPPIPVRVQTVELRAGGGGQRYSAVIWPDVQVELAFKVSGYIESITETRGADGRRRAMQEGDPVRKGDVLARVRDSEYRDRVEEARAGLTRAKGDFDRAAQLYEKRTVSRADYDAAAAQLAASQARFDQAATALDDCVLRATLDGWVMRRTVEVGTLVAPGSSAFTVADTRAVKARFGVPDVAVSALQLGSSQRVRCEALPGVDLTGVITRIAPSADATSRVFEVECTLPNRDNRLKSGMIASLELAGGAALPERVTIPLNAIVRPKAASEGYAAFVLDGAESDRRARERRVDLGEVQGNEIAITSGLAAGEQVVVVGASLLVDGQPVVVVP